MQVNSDNSLTECVNIFITQIEYTANKNRQTLSLPKPRCNVSGVLNLHHGYYTTIMTSRKSFRHNPVPRGTNQTDQKIGIRTVYEIGIIIHYTTSILINVTNKQLISPTNDL